MAIKFFHTPKPKKFTYKPHYYDERKEELERLKKEHGIIDNSDEDYKLALRSKLQRSWHKKKDVKRERSSTIRLIVILIILLGLTYYFFFR